MAWRRVLFLLIAALYCMLAILYAVLTPPWESPDEPAHYLYAKQLAERGRPPLQPTVRQTASFSKDYPYISSNYQWFQPALGYVPAALTYKILEIVAPTSLPTEIPPLNPLFPTNPITYPNLFLHANLSPLTVWTGNWGVLIIRIVSSLLGLVVIFSAYRIGKLLDPADELPGLVAAGWIAFLPQFTFTNASIRNDTAVNAAGALVLFLATLMQMSPNHKNKYAFGLGVSLGLGLLCKHNFVFMVPIGLLAAMLTDLRSPRSWVKPITLIVVPAVILNGTYYLAFDEARAVLVALSKGENMPKPFSWDYFLRIPEPLLIGLFYARFGWANVTIPVLWSRLAFGMWSIGACLTLVQVGRFKRSAMLPALASIAVMGATLVVAFVAVICFNFAIYSPQGRYLFPALAAWSVFGFWGLSHILPRRGKVLVGIAAISFMLIFNLYALFYILVPAYY